MEKTNDGLLDEVMIEVRDNELGRGTMLVGHSLTLTLLSYWAPCPCRTKRRVVVSKARKCCNLLHGNHLFVFSPLDFLM